MSCTTGAVIFNLSSLIITPVSSYGVIFVASCQLFITPARFEGSLGQRLKTKLGLHQGCLTTENTWVRFQLNHEKFLFIGVGAFRKSSGKGKNA